MFYTENLSDILVCARERKIVLEILQAWDTHGLPGDFYNDGVKIAFNRNSGYVFLVNSKYQCAMLNNGKLESFYSSPYAGIEGFFDELVEQYSHMYYEDQEWLRDIAKNLGKHEDLQTLEEKRGIK